MGYPKELYSQVFSELAFRRQKALTVADQRKTEVFEAIPELKELDSMQNQLGIALSQALLKDPRGSSSILQTFHEESDRILARKSALLERAHLPQNFLSPPFSCSICEDTGFIGSERCVCFEEDLRKKSYDALNALSNFSFSRFDDFRLEYYPNEPDMKTKLIPRIKMEETFLYCRKYAASFDPALSPSILMIGATGLGKTHLSLAIARTAIDKGYGVIYGSVPNLMNQLEKEKFRPGEKGSASLGLLQDCDLLILDDLGTEFQTQFTISTVYNLINTRINKRLPTIINTNLTYKELESSYTPRILSRISGAFDTLFFFGSDIRRAQKEERMDRP